MFCPRTIFVFAPLYFLGFEAKMWTTQISLRNGATPLCSFCCAGTRATAVLVGWLVGCTQHLLPIVDSGRTVSADTETIDGECEQLGYSLPILKWAVSVLSPNLTKPGSVVAEA